MRNPAQPSTSILHSRLPAAALALALICELTMVITRPAQAHCTTSPVEATAVFRRPVSRWIAREISTERPRQAAMPV